ncbi:MAG: ABC transporter permease [Chitinophagales bacterium]
MAEQESWDIEISPNQKWFAFNLAEMWRYRDLLLLLIKRDVVATYKQTILGPLWFFIQPILTTSLFLLVFSKVARLPTDSCPPALFYMGGVVMWQYFSTSLLATSNTFVNNVSIFGKVYFPRILLPLSTALSNMVKFAAQLGLYFIMIVYYLINGAEISINSTALLFPLLLLIMVLACLGIGMLVSALSIKYRDVQFLMGFGIQLYMYASPVIYPLSTVPNKWRLVFLLNPMCPVIEGTRFAFTGHGVFGWPQLWPGALMSLALFFIGLTIFNRVERAFVDSV